MTAQETNINFELQYREAAELIEYKDLKIVIHMTDIRGEKKNACKIWKGKQKNPISNYYYNTADRMLQAIDMAKASADAREEYKAQRKAEKAAFKPDVKVGDIYSSSWGYEQTNVDFYQVVEVKGKCTAVLRKIAQQDVEGSNYSHGMACEVVAVKDSFLSEETITKRVGQYGISLSSYASASKWDGQPKYKSWYY